MLTSSPGHACVRAARGGGRYREVLPPSFAAAPNKVTRFSMDTHTHTAQKTQKPSAAFPGHAAKRSVFCVKEDSTGVCCYTRPPGAICMKGRGGGGGTTCARRSLQGGGKAGDALEIWLPRGAERSSTMCTSAEPRARGSRRRGATPACEQQQGGAQTSIIAKQMILPTKCPSRHKQTTLPRAHAAYLFGTPSASV